MRELEACWEALGRTDSRGAYEAMATLGSAPAQAMELFRDRLPVVTSPNLTRITALIAETHHANFAKRQKATRELEMLGEEAEGPLRRASFEAPLETRRRAERVLKTLEFNGLSAETLRGLRAVEVLERVATPEARATLQGLADGVPDARITVEARAAVKRLNQEGLTKR